MILGIKLDLEAQVLGLSLGLSGSLDIATQGLGVGLVPCGLVNIADITDFVT